MTHPDDRLERVTTLELFFDLVFVFTITQLTTVLFRSPTATALLQVVMLTVIWWMYGSYAWLNERGSRPHALVCGRSAQGDPHTGALQRRRGGRDRDRRRVLSGRL